LPPGQAYMHVLIDDEFVTTLKDNLKNMYIDTKEMGLTDNMIKKMMLTYYMTTATTDTIIYTPVNEYEKSLLGVKVDDEFVVPINARFVGDISEGCVYFWGDEDRLGQDDVLYIGTRGTVEIYNDKEEKMKYYDMESLKTIIADYKKAITDEDAKSYISSFEETFKSIYTISEGGMGSVAVISYSTDNFESTDAKVFDYRDIVSNYSMPIELMINFLNLTASTEFIDEISKLVNDSKIELRVNANVITNTTTSSYSGTINGIQAINMQKEDDAGNVTTENILNTGVNSYTTTLQENTTVNTTNYTLTLKSVDCWWCKAQFTTEMQSGEYYIDENGNRQSAMCEIDFTDTFNAEMDGSYSVSSLSSDSWSEDNIFAKLISEISTINYNGDNSNAIVIPVYTGETSKQAKKTVNIKYTDWKQTTQNVEENVQPFIDLLKKEYNDLYNSTTIPGDLLCNGDEMLFELLEMSPYSAKYVDVMKYILYKYSGIDYGVLNIEDIALFNINNFKEIKLSSGLLIEYIHYWENSGGPPTNAAGTHYIIEDDGAGHPTVGYGVDIENSGYKYLFVESGYPTTIGGEVPIEFVDAIEEMELKQFQTEIEALASGLDLTGYQVNALISRAYNCGTSGAVSVLRGSPSMNFKDSYNKYWDKETDDKFEKQDANANFNHKLYVNYMSKPVTSEGKFLPGLERRRKSEWILFQTGYYNVLNAWHVEGGAIIECAKMIHEYMEANNYTYCVYYSNNYEECGDFGKSCGLNTTFEKSKNGFHNTCCATYVSWVLQEAGYLTEEEHINNGCDGAGNLSDTLINKGWKKITYSQIEPGDVLCYGRGHVEIYAGDNTVYNAGSGGAIRGASPHYKGTITTITHALRAPN